MDHYYRIDKFYKNNIDNFKKVSPLIWDLNPNRYPHKKYISLKKQIGNKNIFSLSFFKTEIGLKNEILNHPSQQKRLKTELVTISRIEYNSKYLEKYIKEQDDGILEAWLFYECRNANSHELETGYSDDLIPIEEREFFDIDGKWRKFQDTKIIQYQKDNIKSHFKHLQKDIYYQLSDNELSIYLDNSIEINTTKIGSEDKKIIKNIILNIIQINQIQEKEFRVNIICNRKYKHLSHYYLSAYVVPTNPSIIARFINKVLNRTTINECVHIDYELKEIKPEEGDYLKINHLNLDNEYYNPKRLFERYINSVNNYLANL